jgi:hypothetical protein
VWVGRVRVCLVGSSAFRQPLPRLPLTCLPKLPEDVPLAVRARMWYMHDVAPAQSSRAVRDVLSNTSYDQWTGIGGPIAGPSLPPDSNPLDFYLWGHIETPVYASPVENEETLHHRIVDACQTIRIYP